MTQAIAKKLGPQRIRVNALFPVLIHTPGLMETLAVERSPAKGDPKEFLARFEALMRRVVSCRMART